MANKNTTETGKKEQSFSLPTITARIDRLVNYEESKVKAIASANIGGAFAIHGIKIIDSSKGLFVQMPQTSYDKDGKKEYVDQFHPVTAEARSELNSKVMNAYEQKLAESESEIMDAQEDELPEIGQNM